MRGRGGSEAPALTKGSRSASFMHGQEEWHCVYLRRWDTWTLLDTRICIEQNWPSVRSSRTSCNKILIKFGLKNFRFPTNLSLGATNSQEIIINPCMSETAARLNRRMKGSEEGPATPTEKSRRRRQRWESSLPPPPLLRRCRRQGWKGPSGTIPNAPGGDTKQAISVTITQHNLLLHN